jgi:hypothetical protein
MSKLKLNPRQNFKSYGYTGCQGVVPGTRRKIKYVFI